MSYFPTEALDDDAMQARFEANLEAIGRIAPDMRLRLAAYTPTAKVIVSEDGVYNVELAGTMLYGDKGAYATAEEQLQSYRDNRPKHWFMQGIPSERSLDAHGSEFFQELVTETNDRVSTFNQRPVLTSSYFVFLMGIGLAPHVDGIIEETNCRFVAVFEPNLEFLHLSLRVYDWAGFIKDCKEHGRILNFMVSDEPPHIARQLRAAIRTINPLGMDRSAFITHYPNRIFKRALEIFRAEEGPLVLTGLGFFEDELIMINNTYGNLAKGDALTVKPYPEKIRTPVVVVGGGPSIDLNADFLRENQENLVIVSCGSAIVPLLNHGIKPDFHVLLERDQLLLPLFQETAEEHDLSDIYLVASTTIPPGIGELFKKAIYFFRPGLSTFPLFCTDKSQVLPFPDPEVANAGLSFAQICGFQTFYFVGMDMGSKSSEHHHAKGAWAQTKGLGIRPDHNISIPGNFGGKVLTNPTWMWTRNSLETSISASSQGRSYFNLGDGAAIKGSLPKRAKTVHVPPISGDKHETLINPLVENFPTYSREMFDEAWTKADLFNAGPKYCDKIVESYVDAESLDDRAYQATLMTHFVPNQNNLPLPMIFRGTMYQMLSTVEYYRSRIVDDEDRAFYDEVAKKLFKEHIAKLSDQMLNELSEIVEKYN